MASKQQQIMVSTTETYNCKNKSLDALEDSESSRQVVTGVHSRWEMGGKQENKHTDVALLIYVWGNAWTTIV